MLCSFWSYELSKRSLAREDDSQNQQALKVLLCGGLAGVVTWASIFPLGIVKAIHTSLDFLADFQKMSSRPECRPGTWFLRTSPPA